MLRGMMEVRRAHPQESEALTALAHASKSYWPYPESWIAAWREQLTLSPSFIAEQAVFAAVEDERVVGCYALTACAEEHDPGDGERHIELEHMWIDPSMIGHGLGRRLFEHAVAEARRRGGQALFIDSDPYAEDFYRHLGAVRIGSTRADIEGVRRELPRLRFDL